MVLISKHSLQLSLIHPPENSLSSVDTSVVIASIKMVARNLSVSVCLRHKYRELMSSEGVRQEGELGEWGGGGGSTF